MKMYRRELIDALQNKSEEITGYRWSKADCGNLIDIFTQTIKESMAQGKEPKLLNFGEFTFRTVAAHDITHPETKEIIHLPDMQFPFFKPCEELKEICKEVKL